MSCEQYYRRCPDCGKRIHINMKCSCGGNPWNVKDHQSPVDNGWIDVLKKLPDENGYYICWLTGDEPGLIHYHVDTGWKNGFYDDVVTHWTHILKPGASPVAERDEKMVWVKATRGVFENEDWQFLHFRYQYDHVKLDAYLWEVKDGYLKKIGGNGVILFSQIEWLSESPQEETIDRAIAFAEWAVENNYICTSIPMQKEKYWQKCEYNTRLDDFHQGEEITTQQLYNLFKQQK